MTPTQAYDEWCDAEVEAQARRARTLSESAQRALGAALACDLPTLRDPAVELLATLRLGTLAETAEASGIPLRTLKRWLSLPGVREALQ